MGRPNGQNPTRTARRTITCFAHGGEEGWEGICVDFDIAVQGETFEEVQLLLVEAVRTYVETAMKEEPTVRDELLNRVAPFGVRARLAFGFLWHTLRHRKDGGDTAGFSMPCPA